MIAILNRVAHLLMQMFPGFGGARRPVDVGFARTGVERRPPPTSCAGFIWTQTLLANLRAISRRTACEDEIPNYSTPHILAFCFLTIPLGNRILHIIKDCKNTLVKPQNIIQFIRCKILCPDY